MVKKKIEYTKQGYSYVRCNNKECYSWGGACICDNCSKVMHNNIYLIYVLNSAICENCFKEWIEDARKYEEDLQLQKQNHINYYNFYGLEVLE